MTRARTAPLLVSACFILGALYTLVAFSDINCIWSPEQQILFDRSAARASPNAQMTENEEDLESSCWHRPPPVWPHSFVITQQRIPDSNSKFGPATIITYYDYNQGGNLIQIFPQDNDDEVLWDLELNSGQSYYFYPSRQTCNPAHMPVGILRPDWLEGATPLGPSKSKNDRLVCGWTKLDFIDYYADASTGEPDSWYFHGMKATFFVLNYTTSVMIDPALFDPPEYCVR